MRTSFVLVAQLCLSIMCLNWQTSFAQSRVQGIFPAGTITHANIPYAGDTLRHHLLDVYTPPNATTSIPLIVWVHGGAWMQGDKYSDMSYMKSTIKGFLDSGYALASIDYRYSTEAIFPAQIQDCNQALEFLYQHAAQFKFNRDKIALIGFSAGGHLASLLGLSHNNNVAAFYPKGVTPHFKIQCVLDFYGPSDLVALGSYPDTSINNERNPVSILLGALPLLRPDLAKQASPATYVDKNDPPFIIVQGEKDESVPYTQSVMLSSWLTLAGVANQLIVVPNAPHYGEMFDTDDIRNNLFRFLAAYLK